MSPQKSSEDRLARYFVVGLAIIALVIVAWLDIGEAAEVNTLVYWILGGAILGAENLANVLRK